MSMQQMNVFITVSTVYVLGSTSVSSPPGSSVPRGENYTSMIACRFLAISKNHSFIMQVNVVLNVGR